jgi:fructose-1,6-bisphosphatase/inositol monophosphatase family enzyme
VRGLTLGQAQDVAALLRAAARTEVLPRFRRLPEAAVRAKSGPLDLVTDADEAAERMIHAGLLSLFPGALIVGEEAASADPRLIEGLAEADLAFVVDPVDGTNNFAAGVPLFGCMAAAMRRGETIAAWIHDPMGDDTAIALRGEGAWLDAGDGSGHIADLRVAPPVPLDRMVGAVSWSWLPRERRAVVTSRLPLLAATVNFRCAAAEYRLAAGGGAHLLLYNRLMPWDHLPGGLIHREAGGFSARFDGSPYLPGMTSGGLIVAPDRMSWEAAHEAFLGA